MFICKCDQKMNRKIIPLILVGFLVIGIGCIGPFAEDEPEDEERENGVPENETDEEEIDIDVLGETITESMEKEEEIGTYKSEGEVYLEVADENIGEEDISGEFTRKRSGEKQRLDMLLKAPEPESEDLELSILSLPEETILCTRERLGWDCMDAEMNPDTMFIDFMIPEKEMLNTLVEQRAVNPTRKEQKTIMERNCDLVGIETELRDLIGIIGEIEEEPIEDVDLQLEVEQCYDEGTGVALETMMDLYIEEELGSVSVYLEKETEELETGLEIPEEEFEPPAEPENSY